MDDLEAPVPQPRPGNPSSRALRWIFLVRADARGMPHNGASFVPRRACVLSRLQQAQAAVLCSVCPAGPVLALVGRPPGGHRERAGWGGRPPAFGLTARRSRRRSQNGRLPRLLRVRPAGTESRTCIMHRRPIGEPPRSEIFRDSVQICRCWMHRA